MSNSSEICTVCLSSNAILIEVSATDTNQMKLSSKLRLCVPEVDWSGNCCICPKCIDQLEIAYIFCRLCLQSYEVRRQQTLRLIKAEEPPLESKEISDFQMNSCLNEDDILGSSLMSINEVNGLTSEDHVVQRLNQGIENYKEEIPDIEYVSVDDIEEECINLDNVILKTEESSDIVSSVSAGLSCSENWCNYVKMDTDSGEENSILPEIVKAAKVTSENVLPTKSKKNYEAVYKSFMEWRECKKVNSFSENVILAYFGELAEKYKSSTLWTQYSMLRSTLDIRHNIKLESYVKLRAFLKRKSDGYQTKKAKTFTPEEINSFIKYADDQKYLATKVILIMGIMGACRCNEMKEMNIGDLQDLKTAMLVNVPNTKTKTARKFTITGEFYEIVKKYVALRPPNVVSPSFFLNYQNGKCSSQNIGINKFSAMGKQIATFLKLPNPEMYTGHSFRRSSATLLVDAGADITTLREWKSTTAAEGYIDDLMINKMNTVQKIFQSVQTTKTVNENLTMNITTRDVAATRPVPGTRLIRPILPNTQYSQVMLITRPCIQF